MWMDLFHIAPGWDHYILSLWWMAFKPGGGGLLHKYMDDSIVTVEVSNPADSHLQEDTDNIVQFPDNNYMKINGNQSKEMVINLKTYLHLFYH